MQACSAERDKVSAVFRKLPDMEKKINKLYHYAVKTTSASKAVYFQDLNTARLKEFRETMEKMEEAWESVYLLTKNSKKFKSSRLKQLVTPANATSMSL